MNAATRNSRFDAALNQIEPSLGIAGTVALGANAANHQSVSVRVEAICRTHVVQSLLNRFILEFDHLAAFLAEQVFVLRVAVVVFVDRSEADFDLAEQSGFDQLSEISVDGRPADFQPGLSDDKRTATLHGIHGCRRRLDGAPHQ